MFHIKKQFFFITQLQDVGSWEEKCKAKNSYINMLLFKYFRVFPDSQMFSAEYLLQASNRFCCFICQ